MMNELNVKIAEMILDYKHNLDDVEIDTILSHSLALTCSIIEELIKEGKIKLC